MNPHTKEASQREAFDVCEFLNQRFGYSFCLAITLKEFGVPEDKLSEMLLLAKDRQIDAFKDLLKIYGHKSSPGLPRGVG